MNKPILLAVLAVATALAQPKLYVMDCGTIAPMNPQLYDLKAEEIKGPPRFLHPLLSDRPSARHAGVGRRPDSR
jgi:hypothetical protein